MQVWGGSCREGLILNSVADSIAWEMDLEGVALFRARGVWLCVVQLLFKKGTLASNAFGSLFHNKKFVRFCGPVGITDQ